MDETKQLTTPSMTPAALLQLAVEKGADVERLAQLMDLQQKWEANEARKAYVGAMGRFKAEPPKLVKNKQVSFGQTSYAHATLDQVSAVVGKALSAVGISHRWEVEQGEFIRVTCVLTHELGHSERTVLQAPADTSGSKNAIQSIGSTVTYLQRYSLLAATGMAVEGQDDDGRGASAGPGMDEGQRADFLASITGAGDVAELQKVFTAAYTAAKKAKDAPSMRALTEAKDAKKKALAA